MEKYVEMFAGDLNIGFSLACFLGYTKSILKSGEIKEPGIREVFESGLSKILETHIPIIEQEIGKEIDLENVFFEEAGLDENIDWSSQQTVLTLFRDMLYTRYETELRTLRYSVQYILDYLKCLVDYSKNRGVSENKEIKIMGADPERIAEIYRVFRKYSLTTFTRFYEEELNPGSIVLYGGNKDCDLGHPGVEGYKEYLEYLVGNNYNCTKDTDLEVLRFMVSVKIMVKYIKREIEFLT